MQLAKKRLFRVCDCYLEDEVVAVDQVYFWEKKLFKLLDIYSVYFNRACCNHVGFWVHSKDGWEYECESNFDWL